MWTRIKAALTSRFLIQLNYKSGNFVRLWFFKFVVNGTNITWVCCPGNQILMHGGEHIESAHVIKTSRRIFSYED